MTQFITALDDSDEDDGGYNLEGSENISAGLFSTSLQVWAFAQNRLDVTVNEAALAFNTTPEIIREAVERHYWMMLGPNDVIDHEGE